MKIFLHELTLQETLLDFTQDDAWVKNAVFQIDEISETSPFSVSNPHRDRSISVHMNLRKVDEVVVIEGKIKTFIELICSRCATPFEHFCKPKFSALFCKDPIMAGVGHLQKHGSTSEIGRPAGQNQGFARHAHDTEADEAILEGKDLDITYLSHDYIELSNVLTEQLQLQVPFQPLCKENCNGICPQCGTDLNLERCACDKRVKAHPFSVLSDFKI